MGVPEGNTFGAIVPLGAARCRSTFLFVEFSAVNIFVYICSIVLVTSRGNSSKLDSEFIGIAKRISTSLRSQ